MFDKNSNTNITSQKSRKISEDLTQKNANNKFEVGTSKNE